VRRVWFAVLAGAVVAATGGEAGGARGRCAQALPRGVKVPAPIVVTTRCGRFRLQARGWVVYKGARTLPVPKGSNYFPDLTWYRLSRGRHLLIGRGLEQLWRSHRRYPAGRRGYVGGVVLGVRKLSFNYSGRLYVARYGGREHLVARGEVPVALLSGQLLSWRVHGFALVLRGAGTVVVPHAVEPRWDREAGMVVFRTGRRLRAFDGRRVRLLANRYALGVKGNPVVEPLGQFVLLHDRRRLVLVGYEGRVVAAAPLPKPRTQDDVVSSAVVSNGAGTAVAFTATRRWNSRETVYMLRAGARRARAVFSARPDIGGCGYAASLAWHGRWLLYSSGDQRIVVIDGAGQTNVDLSRVVARLPGYAHDGIFQIAWAPAP
jgi:hypothetical protein